MALIRTEPRLKTEAWGNSEMPLCLKAADQHLVSPYNIIVYKKERRLKGYENKEN